MNDVLMAMLLSQRYERLKGWLQRGNEADRLAISQAKKEQLMMRLQEG